MDFDVTKIGDTLGEGIQELGDTIEEKTASFHENFVSKVVPVDGKYGEAATFAAEMIPGVSEYNAIREGDWQRLATEVAIGAAVSVGIATLGTGVTAVAGAGIVGVVGIKAVSEVAEIAVKAVAKEGGQIVAKAAVREGAEAAGEKALKEGSEMLAKSTVKESGEVITTQVTKEASEALTKNFEGGSYKNLLKKDIIDKSKYEVHHMPSQSSYGNIQLSKYDGPAIRMDKFDHQKTASWGSSKDARAFRKEQQNLIEKGRIREAIQMDIEDIQTKFGKKYDDAIKGMLDYIDKLELEGKLNV